MAFQKKLEQKPKAPEVKKPPVKLKHNAEHPVIAMINDEK